MSQLPQKTTADLLTEKTPTLPTLTSAKLPDAPTYANYKLPDTPTYTNYSLPNQPTLAKVEKPSFGKYFDENIKPVFNKMLTENLQQNPKLINDFAATYRRDMNPLIEDLGAGIYGRNVGATSGLGAEAYAKGAERIMRPITDYANTLNANTIGQYQNTMNTMAQSGISAELNQNLSDYNRYQDQLYEQGRQTYADTLANKKSASDYANNMAMTNYQNTLGMNQNEANLANTSKNLEYQAKQQQAMADYTSAINRGDMALAQKIAQENQLYAGNIQNAQMKLQAALQNGVNEKGEPITAAEIDRLRMAAQNELTQSNMAFQTKQQQAMADYNNALSRGDMVEAQRIAQENMKLQNELSTESQAAGNKLTQSNMQLQADLSKQAAIDANKLQEMNANREAVLKLASEGKLGAQSADTLAKMIGLTPDQAKELKLSGRDELIQGYLQQMIAANQNPDTKVIDALLATGEKQLLSDDEKKKYEPAINLAPAGMASKVIGSDNRTVTNSLVSDWGFDRETYQDGFMGPWRWRVLNNSANNARFNELYKNDANFRNWVSTIA